MKIIICGKSGAGKDTLKNKFIEKGLKGEISYTSREPRNGEINGENYFYISKEEFEKHIENKLFVQWQLFNGNYYGTHVSEFIKKDVFIMNRSGVDAIVNNSDLSQKFKNELMIIFLDVDNSERTKRILKRDHNIEVSTSKDMMDVDVNIIQNIINRGVLDDKEFSNFNSYSVRMTNIEII